MNEEIKIEWLRRLRSGAYVQGRRKLCRSYDGVVQHCCLGVLCEVAVDAGVLLRRNATDDARLKIYGVPHPDTGEFTLGSLGIALLPQAVVDWAELPDRTPFVAGETLSGWNDDLGATFNDIARMIEEEL